MLFIENHNLHPKTENKNYEKLKILDKFNQGTLVIVLGIFKYYIGEGIDNRIKENDFMNEKLNRQKEPLKVENIDNNSKNMTKLSQNDIGMWLKILKII